MRRSSLQRAIGLLILLLSIIYYSEGHGRISDYVIATLAIIAFWALHAIQFSISNVRTLILVTCLFAIPLFFADQLSFFSWRGGAAGPWTAESFHPSQIGRIEPSHEIATQVYFDHKPTSEERYTKTGAFTYTQDGLDYENSKTALDETLVPRAKAWAQENLRDRSLSDQALRMERFFQKDFAYSLSPGTLNASHPLDEFLFEKKTGYCQHFAGATAALLKLAGTPARVVVGFAGGSWNPLLNTLTYEIADSHAWVEAYDANSKSWVTLDPTSWILQTSSVEWSGALPLAMKWLAVLILLIAVVFVVASKRRDPLRLIFLKVERFERQAGLSATGFTLTERISRITKTYPERAAQLEELIAVYHDAFYRAEPTPTNLERLRKTISN